jgi:tetratricopeptide (TPR) repeat protein
MTAHIAANRGAVRSHSKLAHRLRQAFAAHQAGDIDEAGQIYAEVLQQRPDNFDALHMLGLLEYQRGDFPKALRLIAAALRSNGNSADAWLHLGLVFHAQGEHQKALASYDRALELKPYRADVLSNRRDALAALGRHEAVNLRHGEPQPILRPASTAAIPCKICGAAAPLYDAVDFHRSCKMAGRKQLPLSALPVYYRRCEACGFLFTDAFDDWSEAEFKTHIYNAGYLAVDPDYVESRPRSNADVITRLFGAHKADIRLLDYGGGNDVLGAALRAAGFPVAVTYDPFTADYAQQPEGTFDLVSCFETLEHMPDPMAGIAAMTARLAEPGMIFFSTLLQPPDFENFGLNWWYVGPRNGHVSIFSRNALILAWRRHGYYTASFNENLHIAFRTLPAFAKHLLKGAASAVAS